MQAITTDLLRDLFARAEAVEDDEWRAARKADADRLARIDAQIKASPLSAPLWLEVTADRDSRISRAVYAVGVWLLIATAAALAGSLLGKAATNNAETLRQIEDGRAAW